MTTAFESNAFQTNAFQIDSVVVVGDTHDGASHTKREARRNKDYREAQEALRSQIKEAFEALSGEARLPEITELPRWEQNVKRVPRKERPNYQAKLVQLKTWTREITEINRILLDMEDEEILLLMH